MSLYEFMSSMNDLYPDNSTRTFQQISEWVEGEGISSDLLLYFYNYLCNECPSRKMFVNGLSSNYRIFIESMAGQEVDEFKQHYATRELGRYKTPNQLCNLLFLFQKYPERYENSSEMIDFYDVWKDMLEIRSQAIQEHLNYEEIQDVLWNVKKDILSNIAVSIFYRERLLTM